MLSVCSALHSYTATVYRLHDVLQLCLGRPHFLVVQYVEVLILGGLLISLDLNP